MNNFIEELPFTDSIKKRLSELVDLLLCSGIGCTRIVLFGSYARAEEKVGSDLDILVLTEEEVDRCVKGGLYADFDERNADLVFYTEESFSKSGVLLTKLIRRDGVLLWKR